MEPPALPALPPVPPPVTYPESADSSPRSRTTDGWDDLPAPIAGNPSLRLMCSYGGHIIPRPHDKSLCYVGGDTRIVAVDRTASLAALTARLSTSLLNGRRFTLKYQLPSEDLDSLISVSTDEDLDNMIDEYDRMVNSTSNSVKRSRLRLFLFPSQPESTQSMGQILETSAKSDDWFLNALNSAGLLNRGFSDSASGNNLIGLDDVIADATRGRDGDGSIKNAKEQQQQQQQPQHQVGLDMHSFQDSAIPDTSSSFGSTSSSPSLANLPPIRVHVEDAGGIKPVIDQKFEIEDQFGQMNIGGLQKQQQEDGFLGISSPHPPPVPVTVWVPNSSMGSTVISGEYHTRVNSDDDRSDHGMPVGYRKPLAPQPQPHNPPPNQAQQKPGGGGGYEMLSPDSVSSENSLVNNPLSRPKPVVYQTSSGMNTISNNPVDQKTNPSDPNTRTQIQDSGYVLQHQYEQLHAQQQKQQHQQQQHQQQHRQQLQQQQQHQQHEQQQQHQQEQQQQQQHQQQQQQQQQQQFIHAAQQYINHHPTGAMQMPGYIPVYPSSQQQQSPQHQQPYPVYYVTAPGPTRQTQAYNVPVQQASSMSEAPPPSGSIISSQSSSITSSHLQTPQNPTLIVPQLNGSSGYNPIRHAGNPEMDSGGVYRTTVTGGPQLVHVPQNQHQNQGQQHFMSYSQINHPAHPAVASSNYGQIYYGQPPAHVQYQTMVMPDGSTAQLSTESVKQQIRSSQQL